VSELPVGPTTPAGPPPLAQPAGADDSTPVRVDASTTLLALGLLLVAANLRPFATSVGPLLHQIRSGVHLDGASAGLLVTLPVLCFGIVAPAAPLLSRRLGIGRTIAIAIAIITAGLVLRVAGGVALLFIGTMVTAAGAACGNVLLPVIVRRSFPERIGRISALYTTSLVAIAALSAGLAVPLAHLIGRGWQGGLGVWALPAAVGFLVWLPQLRRATPATEPVSTHVRVRDVTRDPLTWSLTLFFGVQSWSYYSMLAWQPSIFESHGISATKAGFLLGFSSVLAIPGALFAPRLATRMRSQGAMVFWLTMIVIVGYVGLDLSATSHPALWVALIGLGQGACFPLALTMIVLRSGSPRMTPAVSTHVQSIGYLLAAAGPITVGALHDASGSWTLPLVVLTVLLVPQALTGLAAGRSRVIEVRGARDAQG
jgi:CP family cyanate transporter-like MFS transporter